MLVSSRSTQSHVQGVIAANWNPPYDLLVHPPSLVTGLKPGDRLAQPNFLDSVGGGITLAEVSTVRAPAAYRPRLGSVRKPLTTYARTIAISLGGAMPATLSRRKGFSQGVTARGRSAWPGLALLVHRLRNT